ncbi:hypothetical protein F2Q70_00008837 [Brassica cretica]|uniref:Uncharacterized protein n=1 Tax=Brassica cretica TaxID=69181 RepID=A0A8S9M308_BRACR|nr:hypothetical protein F2Q70_00008837 [Brassica cretica]
MVTDKSLTAGGDRFNLSCDDTAAFRPSCVSGDPLETPLLLRTCLPSTSW